MILILKSFFRKKTTIIFLIIYTLIIISLLGLFYGLKVLNVKEKENYKGAFIYINSTDISKLRNINNINSYKYGLKLDNEYDFAIYKAIKETENGVVMTNTAPEKLKKYIFINNCYQWKNILISRDDNNITLANTNISFIVKGKNESALLYEISKEKYDSLKDNYDTVLIVYLDDYLKSEKTVVDIKKEFNNEETSLITNKHKYDYSKYIFIVKVFIIVILLLFGVIVFFTSFNIVEEENGKNDIYYKLGFEKIFLNISNMLKIVLLLFSSMLLSSAIFYIIYTIYKLIFL